MRSIFIRIFIAFVFLSFVGVTTSCQRSACYTKPSVAKKKRAKYNSYQYR
ncbi:hypothetical protein [Bernardetia sp.]|nr:hypothetical protein [Bernardetia sp.]